MPSLALDQVILVSAMLLGALAAGYAALAPGAPIEEEGASPLPRGPGVWLGLALSLALFLGAILLRQPPFSPGGRLGAGVLAGAVSAAVAQVLLRQRLRSGAGAGLAAGGLSLLVVAGTMFAYRGYPNDALFGLALGQAVVALLSPPRPGGLGRSPAWSPAEAMPLLTALLAAGVTLAIARYREFSGAERLAHGEKLWWTGPLVVCGSFLIGQIAGAALGRGVLSRLLITAGAGAVVLGIFAASFPRYLPLLPPVAAGYVSAALLIALARAPGGPGGALLGSGLALVLLVVAYRFLGGYGIALAALGFAGTALAWERPRPLAREVETEPEAAPLPLAGLALLTFAALFRVYYARYGLDETSVYLTAHYTLIGLILGALAPLGLGVRSSEFGVRSSDEAGEGEPRVNTTLAGVGVLAVALLLPALLVVFWGIRACAGLLLGLSLGQAYLLWVRLLEDETGSAATGRLARAAGAAPALILALVCVQALELFDRYAGLLTRTHRIAIVLAIAALFPLAALVRALVARRNVENSTRVL